VHQQSKNADERFSSFLKKLKRLIMSKSSIESNKERFQEARRYWDREAPNFDDEPDHGLRDSIVYEAWESRIKTWFPASPSRVLDIGCGTGSLSVMLIGLGYTVTGVDFSPAMIDIAKAKALTKGLDVEFAIMDAAFPGLAPRQFGAVICRHLLWALPEPGKVLQRWTRLLKQDGRLVLVEGYWEAGGGLHLDEVRKILPSSFTGVTIENLSDHPDLWGKHVTDERYVIIACLE
jgi:2-polyprenyl-3-methyl-5-hydroxy-6-metoxy-1,4-benzoquinol methylase